MMTVKNGMDDHWYTWIDTEYALPATDENMIVTVKEATGRTYVEMGFFDGASWLDFNGNELERDAGFGSKRVIAWASVVPYERTAEKENGHE